mgnify:CR=1 FL=1
MPYDRITARGSGVRFSAGGAAVPVRGEHDSGQARGVRNQARPSSTTRGSYVGPHLLLWHIQTHCVRLLHLVRLLYLLARKRDDP